MLTNRAKNWYNKLLKIARIRIVRNNNDRNIKEVIEVIQDRFGSADTVPRH